MSVGDKGHGAARPRWADLCDSYDEEFPPLGYRLHSGDCGDLDAACVEGRICELCDAPAHPSEISFPVVVRLFDLLGRSKVQNIGGMTDLAESLNSNVCKLLNPDWENLQTRSLVTLAGIEEMSTCEARRETTEEPLLRVDDADPSPQDQPNAYEVSSPVASVRADPIGVNPLGGDEGGQGAKQLEANLKEDQTVDAHDSSYVKEDPSESQVKGVITHDVGKFPEPSQSVASTTDEHHLSEGVHTNVVRHLEEDQSEFHDQVIVQHLQMLQQAHADTGSTVKALVSTVDYFRSLLHQEQANIERTNATVASIQKSMDQLLSAQEGTHKLATETAERQAELESGLAKATDLASCNLKEDQSVDANVSSYVKEDPPASQVKGVAIGTLSCPARWPSVVLPHSSRRCADEPQSNGSRKDDDVKEEIRVLPEEVGADGVSTSIVLTTGSQVMLIGLLSARELNGERAHIISFNEDSGRYGVLLDDGRQKSVKRSNLLLVEMG